MKDKSKKSTYSTTFGVDPKIFYGIIIPTSKGKTYSAVLSTELINNLNGIKDLYKAHMTLYLTKPLGLCHARKSTYIKKRPLNAAAK